MARPTASHAASQEETRLRILQQAIGLFARSGFDGVSMRDVAAAVGVTPAALYYHFADKEQLFLAVLGRLFSGDIGDTVKDLGPPDQPWQRLETFIHRLVLMLSRNPELQRLMQWVLLDTDDARLQRLADNLFTPFYLAIVDLVQKVGAADDPFLQAHSIFSMVVFPFETAGVGRFLPGFRLPQQEPELLAQHICRLLRHGLAG